MKFRKTMWGLTKKTFRMLDHNRSESLIRTNLSPKKRLKKKKQQKQQSARLTSLSQVKAELRDWNRQKR